MNHVHTTISLGFTDQEFPPGVHVCQIYSDDEERQESVLKFLLSGLKGSERTCCFSDKVKEEALREYFEVSGISYDEATRTGACTLGATREVYFEGGRFDPQRMVDLLKQYHLESVSKGFCAARVIGEMNPEVQHLPGGSGLLEYEARVSLLLEEHPVTAVCQYSARDFSGAVIMDILKVHPYMVVRGSIIHNPFYIPAAEYLKGLLSS